jgi:ribosomal protein S18 acetylase RimI-like enzyme
MSTSRSARIRPARPADAAALAALELRCFPGDRMSARQYRRHAASPNAVVLVAGDAGGAAIGSAVMFFRTGSARARLYSIAVDPAARGRGLGGALLAAAESAARRRGATALRLEVRQDNPVAIAMYEARGYRRIGARAGYYEDGADAWRYETSLDGRPAGPP